MRFPILPAVIGLFTLVIPASVQPARLQAATIPTAESISFMADPGTGIASAAIQQFPLTPTDSIPSGSVSVPNPGFELRKGDQALVQFCVVNCSVWRQLFVPVGGTKLKRPDLA
jgi:hypothetical protein